MSLICYEFKEPCLDNILHDVEIARLNKTFKNGLYYYALKNCTCTLEDKGYHIYRSPNLTVANDGHVMWGGLVIKNSNNIFNLIQNHTYVILIDVEGKSSNSPEMVWSNNCGNGSGGLKPEPTNTEEIKPLVNFEGKMTAMYKFTISDSVYKTCTSSYSSFVKGNEYVSYRDFKFGFVYSSTGELGTDLYLTNLRMYDITGKDLNGIININKNGEVYALDFNELPDIEITKTGAINVNEYVEM